jgi:glycosyltransferase involved in cell wall biosynthesis
MREANQQAMRNHGNSVMMVIGTLAIGGTERQLALIAAGLVRRGWEVWVFSLAGEGPLSETLSAAGVRVLASSIQRPARESGPRKVVRLCATLLHLYRHMHRRRVAVAHFFLPEAYIIGAVAATLARVPVRIMSRRSLNNYQRKRRLIGGLERLLHRSLTCVLGNSRKVIGELREEGVSPRRLGLIYNGVDISEFPLGLETRTRSRAALNIANDTLVLIILANLIPYKGHADLLGALAAANANLPNGWRLLLVGRDDGIQASLTEQAAIGGIAENVLFLGLRRDVAALLACADIGLLVSHEEGFSNAVLEKMASGLPMIVTDVGGNAEAVTHQETGIVVPPGDKSELTRAIVTLARNPDLRARYGAAGRQRASERFGFDATIASHDRLYRALLAGRLPGELQGIAAEQI